MKVIIINPKTDFSEDQISDLESLGEVVWIEDGKYENNPVFRDSSEKIIALGPEIVDWKFPNEFINTITNLKAICLPTTGFSWIKGGYLQGKEIILTNVPKYSTESVTEYAISMMLNLVKKLPLLIKNDWKLDYEKHQGWEVKGKIMGIIGLGSIGTRIAEMGKAMGMNVVYWSKNSRNEMFEYKELEELLEISDFIFPTLAKNMETQNILSKEKIDLMKKNSFIVSITGQDFFDFDYVVQKIKEKKLAGLAMESENKNMKDYEGNIYITPPIAWFTKEAFEEDIKIWIKTIESVVRDNPINVVNN